MEAWKGREKVQKILEHVIHFTNSVEILIQNNLEVRTLVLAGARAGIWACRAIMQVRINSLLYIAHAACEKKYAENILIPRVGRFEKCRRNK